MSGVTSAVVIGRSKVLSKIFFTSFVCRVVISNFKCVVSELETTRWSTCNTCNLPVSVHSLILFRTTYTVWKRFTAQCSILIASFSFSVIRISSVKFHSLSSEMAKKAFSASSGSTPNADINGFARFPRISDGSRFRRSLKLQQKYTRAVLHSGDTRRFKSRVMDVLHE